MHENLDDRYERYRSLFREIRRPFVFIDLRLLRRNAEMVRERAGGKRVRVATKSVRCRAVLEMILQMGAPFNGLMAYSAEEAVFLFEHGFNDILIGYPVVDSVLLFQVAQAIDTGARITLMVDGEEHVRLVGEAARNAGIEIPVCLDVDMSTRFGPLFFGVRRSSISNLESVERIARVISVASGVRLAGIMGYEAQIAGVPDHYTGLTGRGMTMAIRLLKGRSIPDIRDRRKRAVEAIQRIIGALEFINAGGSGSLEFSAAEPWVTEVTSGSAFYGSALFDRYRQFHPEPAVAFALEIVRLPAPGVYTCSGGGYVASGSPGPDRLPSPYLPLGLSLLPHEGAGEVQTPVRGEERSDEKKLSLGDPIFFRHAKAGEVCEHFDTMYLVEDERIVERVPTYRGDHVCFF